MPRKSRKHSVGESYIAALAPGEAGAFDAPSIYGVFDVIKSLRLGAQHLDLQLDIHRCNRTVYFWRTTKTYDKFEWPPEQNSANFASHKVRKLPVDEAKHLVEAPPKPLRSRRPLGEKYIAALGPDEAGRFSTNSYSEKFSLLDVLRRGAERMNIKIRIARRKGAVYFWRETRIGENFNWPPEEGPFYPDRHTMHVIPLAEAKRLTGPEAKEPTIGQRYINSLSPGQKGTIRVTDKKAWLRERRNLFRGAAALGVKIEATKKGDMLIYWLVPTQTEPVRQTPRVRR